MFEARPWACCLWDSAGLFFFFLKSQGGEDVIPDVVSGHCGHHVKRFICSSYSTAAWCEMFQSHKENRPVQPCSYTLVSHCLRTFELLEKRPAFTAAAHSCLLSHFLICSVFVSIQLSSLWLIPLSCNGLCETDGYRACPQLTFFFQISQLCSLTVGESHCCDYWEAAWAWGGFLASYDIIVVC